MAEGGLHLSQTPNLAHLLNKHQAPTGSQGLRWLEENTSPTAPWDTLLLLTPSITPGSSPTEPFNHAVVLPAPASLSWYSEDKVCSLHVWCSVSFFLFKTLIHHISQIPCKSLTLYHSKRVWLLTIVLRSWEYAKNKGCIEEKKGP